MVSHPPARHRVPKMPPLTDIQRATVEDLASGPLQSVASLRGLVTAHVTTARSHAAQTALLDLDLAERLAAQCLELLTHHLSLIHI